MSRINLCPLVSDGGPDSTFLRATLSSRIVDGREHHWPSLVLDVGDDTVEICPATASVLRELGERLLELAKEPIKEAPCL